MKETQVEIQQTKEELANKPSQALKLITFLNSKNREELEELKIQDRTKTILQIKNVLNKWNIMNSLKERCKYMNLSITNFLAKYTILTQAGLPDIHGFNEKLMI